MSNKSKKNLLKAVALVLAVVMVLSGVPVRFGLLFKTEATVTCDGEQRTVVVASSDYQYPNQGSGSTSSAISKPTSGEGLTRWNQYS